MNSQPISAPAEPTNETIAATCQKHGSYTARRFVLAPGCDPITTTCQLCREERIAADRAHAEDYAGRVAETQLVTAFQNSLIPARYTSSTLTNFATDTAGQKRAHGLAVRYVESFPARGSSLIFCGKPGTGKTHLACAIGRAVIEVGHAALFATVLSAIRHIKDTYRKDSERSEEDAIFDFLEPGLLILDEVGAQVGSEHEKLLMFEIINERYQRCRSTILISNLNADELGKYLGDRVMDRFRETGAIVAFDWQSYRGARK